MDRGFFEDVVGLFMLAMIMILFFILMADYQPTAVNVATLDSQRDAHRVLEGLMAGNESVTVMDELLDSVVHQDKDHAFAIGKELTDRDLSVSYSGSSTIPSFGVFTGGTSGIREHLFEMPFFDGTFHIALSTPQFEGGGI